MDIFVTVRNYISVIISVILAFFGICTVDIGGAANENEEETRVMSFNIRCGEFEQRGKIVPELIADYAPDSIGIQECTHQWYVLLRAFLSSDYDFVGVGRDTGDRSLACGEMSMILYKKDKYNLVESGTFWLSETPNEVSLGWDGACRRICTYAVLENKETGEKYAHVNTHLDHVGQLARENGVELVKQKALSFDIPTVVTGDFNTSKRSSLYYALINGGLCDTQDAAEDTMYGRTFHNYKGGEDGAPIDYILVNDKVSKVKTYKIIRDKIDDKFVSDHYPIYSDIIL